jgi:tetratricopeptide (TPR) repeat protein
LAEAYLGMGRFMEAMVVCKKGVKAHPTKPEPRMLLARVYADQGKEKKALEELTAAVAAVTADKALWRMTGDLQLKLGDRDAGKVSLLKAFDLDNADSETQAVMKRYNVEPPKAAPPPPAPAPPPQLQPVSTSGVHPAVNGAPVQTAGVPGPAAAPVRRRPTYEELERIEMQELRTRRKRNQPLMKASVGLVGALLISSAIYYAYGQYRATKSNEFKREMKTAVDEMKHDSFSSYQKATEAADRALVADEGTAKNAFYAHSLLAYVWTLRWTEHGGGDNARDKAQEHIDAAHALSKKLDMQDANLYAADALFQAYSGQGAKAASELARQVASLRDERRESSTLNLTLGMIQMETGDSEGARDSLVHAQELAQSDARVYAALGNYYRRQGQDRMARDNFDAALRYERDHNEAMLGKALLILDRDQAVDYPTATKLIKKLLEMEPPPSPRQLAVAHLARALLVERVMHELPSYKPDFQKNLSELTAVPMDKAKNLAEITREDDAGFSLDGKNPDLHLLKGKRLLVDGQVDAAIQEIRAAIDLDKTRAQLYVELARVLMQKPGGEKEAAAALTTALRSMGDSPKLLVLLGQAYWKENNLGEAVAQFQRALADPKVKNPEARFYMGSIFREQKDYTRAADALDRAVKEYAGQRTKVAEVYTELGRVYDEKGDRAKADEIYQAALKSDPDYSPGYFYYGRFMASGDKTAAVKAKELLKEYLNREPTGALADEATKRIATL